MRVRAGRLDWSFAILLLLLGLGNAAHRAQALDVSGQDYRIAVILNSPVRRCKARDRLPVVVTVANLTDKKMYVAKIEEFYVVLRDSNGRVVMGDPIPDPPPAPEDRYVNEDGRRVLIDPLWELEGLEGIARVLTDALRRYHKNLKKGVYTVSLNIDSMHTYSAKDVIRKDDSERRRSFVRVGASSERVRVVCSSFTIEIE